MILTVADLLAWLPQEQARHQQVASQQCACGWEEPTEQVDWAAHHDVAVLNELLDNLPSNTWSTSSGRSEQVPAGKLIPDLYATIDQRHEDEAKLAQALQEIARGTDNPRERARAALNAWYHDAE